MGTPTTMAAPFTDHTFRSSSQRASRRNSMCSVSSDGSAASADSASSSGSATAAQMRVMRSKLDVQSLAGKSDELLSARCTTSRPHLRRKMLRRKTARMMGDDATVSKDTFEDLAKSSGYRLGEVLELFDPERRRGRQ